MANVSGRLVTDGTGRLFIMPTADNDEVVSSIHVMDEDDVPTDERVADMVEVRWDADAGGYVEVADGQSHNDVHETNTVEISGTTGPLYDADGNLVYEGDPHHSGPLPDDEHYDADAPNNTKADTLPDEISSTATSHTEAFT